MQNTIHGIGWIFSLEIWGYENPFRIEQTSSLFDSDAVAFPVGYPSEFEDAASSELKFVVLSVPEVSFSITFFWDSESFPIIEGEYCTAVYVDISN